MTMKKKCAFLMLAAGTFAGWRAISQTPEQLHAVSEAASQSGILSSPKPDSDLIKHMAVGFNPGAPLDAIQRLLFLAWDVPLRKGDTATLSPDQLCQFLGALDADPAYRNNLDWQASVILYRPLVSYFLGPFEYDPKTKKTKGCGGVLKGIRVSADPKRPGGRRAELLFSQQNMEQAIPALDRTYYVSAAPAGNGLFKATLLLNDDPAEARGAVDSFVNNKAKYLLGQVPASDYNNRFATGAAAMTPKVRAKISQAQKHFRDILSRRDSLSDAALNAAVKDYFEATNEDSNRYNGSLALATLRKPGADGFKGAMVLNVQGDENGGKLIMRNPTGVPTLRPRAEVNHMTLVIPVAPTPSRPMLMIGEVKVIDNPVKNKNFQTGFGGSTGGL